MADILIYLVVIFAVMQPSKKRLYPALIFAILTLSHLFFSQHLRLEGFYYYFSACLTDAIIMLLILNTRSEITQDLMEISIAFISLNAVGWLLWYFYFPPYFYNGAAYGLYLYAIYKLSHGGGDVGDIRNYRWNIGLFGHPLEIHRHIHRVGKK